MAMYDKKSVEDLDVAGKRVIVRVDFNVPLDKETGTEITDDKRIKGALPTIKYLVDNNAKVILVSHLGRPKGEVNPKYSLAPVAKRLSELPCFQTALFSVSDLSLPLSPVLCGILPSHPQLQSYATNWYPACIPLHTGEAAGKRPES